MGDSVKRGKSCCLDQLPWAVAQLLVVSCDLGLGNFFFPWVLVSLSGKHGAWPEWSLEPFQLWQSMTSDCF